MSYSDDAYDVMEAWVKDVHPALYSNKWQQKTPADLGYTIASWGNALNDIVTRFAAKTGLTIAFTAVEARNLHVAKLFTLTVALVRKADTHPKRTGKTLLQGIA